jgi:predicted MPP superfamily phosphohydrolase
MSRGRGTSYSVRRGVVESALRIAYRGDWPARVWSKVPSSCDVRVVRRTIPLLPLGAAPLRFGFVSDIHIGPTTPIALLDAAFGALADAELDVLLLGGDYVFLDATPKKARLLASLVARVPAKKKIAVLGNHDLWAQHPLLERALESASADVLCNAHVEVAPDCVVVGLDEPWTGHIDAERAMRGITASTIVVLCHSPDGLPNATAHLPRANALYVCGHTHGGHIATPWGPIIAPGRLGKKYPHGFHDVPPFVLHVSRGVGGSEVPMRTFASPEVAVIDLVS